MPLSKEWTDYHLTPRGWQVGSQKLDNGQIHEVPSPADGVLTIRWYEELSHWNAELKKWGEETGRNADQAQIDELLQKYKALEDHLADEAAKWFPPGPKRSR